MILKENFSVVNFTESLECFGNHFFAAALTDIRLPDINGFDLTRYMRGIDATNKTHTPIIATTAYAMKSDREKCLAAGMNDYLAKPLEADILDKVLGAHIRAQTEDEAGPGFEA